MKLASARFTVAAGLECGDREVKRSLARPASSECNQWKRISYVCVLQFRSSSWLWSLGGWSREVVEFIVSSRLSKWMAFANDFLKFGVRTTIPFREPSRGILAWDIWPQLLQPHRYSHQSVICLQHLLNWGIGKGRNGKPTDYVVQRTKGDDLPAKITNSPPYAIRTPFI